MTPVAPAPDETVLRRCYKDHCPNGVISRAAFSPTPQDTDGLSVFRLILVSPEQAREGARKPPNEYTVAGLVVRDIVGLGLSVVPTAGGPGHCSIPEITYASYNDKAQKQVQKELTAKLAELANRNVLLAAS